MMPSRLVLMLASAAALAGCGSSPSTPGASPTPTVLVTTVPATRLSLPVTIEGYGEAAPSANGVVTLSVNQPGQVAGVPAVAGTGVAAGQPVVIFAVAPAARSAFAQAETTLRTAREARATTARLLDQQLATRDQLAQADKAVTDAQVALAALAKDGAGNATTILRAPFAGVVATIPVAPGDRTQSGQALATVARAGAMIVTVGIDPARRPDVRVGAPATLRRLDDASGAAIAGHVVRVDATLDLKTRQVDVDIGYPAGSLLSGEALKVSIETGRAESWVVPHAAIAVDDDGKPRIFQLVRGKAKAVPVTIASSEGSRDGVTGALDPNAPVIVGGAYQVDDGDAVRTRAAK